jgi:hypothetical protein
LHISGDTSVALIEGTNNATSGLVAGVRVKAQFYRRAGFSILDESDNEDFFIGRPYASTNQFVITNDGTERLRINTSGNIGIGTSSPTSQLNTKGNTGLLVESNGSANYGVYIESNFAETMGAIGALSQADAGRDGASISFNDFGRGIVFKTNEGASNSEAMRITSAGRLGIGRTPTSNLLEVADTIKLTNLATGEGFIGYNTNGQKLAITATDSVGAGMKFEVGASERARIDDSGNFGINTTSPSSNLHIKTSVDNSVAQGLVIERSVNTDKGYINYNGGGFQFRSTVGDPIVFGNTSNEHMRLTSTGLGIGTTSPSFPLEIKCDSNHRAISFIETGGGTETWQIGVDGDGDLGFFDSTSTTQSITFQDGTGYVGIGTNSPDMGIHLSSTGTNYLRVTNTTTGVGSDFGTSSTGTEIINRQAAPIRFQTNATERMRIDSSGHILFGTTSAGTTHAYFDPSSNSRMVLSLGSSTTTTSVVAAYKNPNGTVGTVSTNGSATSYNTSSDARLKDVTGEARGLDVINALNPVSYNWKADGKADEGLIAQEVLDVVPNAVSQNEEEYYQMDYSKLVVHLVKGMKEQQEQIEALQSEINLLKGE